jgi:5-methylcytosine-specific restriction endonuclease McrA
MEDFEMYRRILELWEQGHSKIEIARLTRKRYSKIIEVTKRFGTVAHLEAFLRGEALPSTDEIPTPKRRYHLPAARKNRRYTDEDIRVAIASSVSFAEVLRKLNLRDAGGNYKSVHDHIKRLGIDISHLKGQGWSRGRSGGHQTARPFEEILVKDSDYTSTHALRKRLIAEGLLQPRCLSCGLTEWLAQPIPLELDHINGDRFDHRLENLRLLCPNCHALTATYRGKNKGR